MTPCYAKLSTRILPILFFGYLINYLDRVNISFARLTMSSSLGIGDAAYGLGAGLFFLGYVIFQVPSNLILERVGARRWLALIILIWGIISASTCLIRHEWQFFTIRLLLGAAESGFFPGAILFLSEWYPSALRGRILSGFLVAIPISGILGGSLSGWILATCHGGGLESWQWLFLLEGAPCLLAALWIFVALPDSPSTVSWLTEEERGRLADTLRRESEERMQAGAPTCVGAALRLPEVWKLCLIYFCTAMGLYGFSFWLPVLLKDLGWQNPLEIGLFSAIPWGVAAIGMIAWGYLADQQRAWRIFAAWAALIGGVGFIGCGLAPSAGVGLLTLSLAAAGVMGMMTTLWVIPGNLLNGTAAAAGIAVINACGNLGGFVSPTLIGWTTQRTGSHAAGLYLTSAILFAASVALFLLRSLDSPNKSGGANAVASLQGAGRRERQS